MRPGSVASLALLTLLAARPADLVAQRPPHPRVARGAPDADTTPRAAMLGLDHDDDDDDGVPDLAQDRLDPRWDDDVVVVEIRGAGAGAARVMVTGGVRVVNADGVSREAVVPLAQGRAEVPSWACEASARAGDASLTVTVGAQRAEVPLTVVAVGFLRGDHARLFGAPRRPRRVAPGHHRRHAPARRRPVGALPGPRQHPRRGLRPRRRRRGAR